MIKMSKETVRELYSHGFFGSTIVSVFKKVHNSLYIFRLSIWMW